jgi:DNA-binding NarL/FixJ family response regulator
VLHKSASTAQLIAAIRDVHAGKLLLDPGEAAELLQLVGERRARYEVEREALGRLTQREREVLRLMAEGLDNQALADRLFVGVETVRTHVARLLRKLGVDSRLQAILLAYRHGVASLSDHPNHPPG